MSDYYDKVTRKRTLTPEDEAMIQDLLDNDADLSAYNARKMIVDLTRPAAAGSGSPEEGDD